MASLGALDLSYNQLTGEIPVELGNLARLWSLDLSNNQLTGEIPEELGNPTYLGALYLSNNQLTGCVPATLQYALRDFPQLGLPWCDYSCGIRLTFRERSDALRSRMTGDDGRQIDKEIQSQRPWLRDGRNERPRGDHPEFSSGWLDLARER